MEKVIVAVFTSVLCTVSNVEGNCKVFKAEEEKTDVLSPEEIIPSTEEVKDESESKGFVDYFF